MTINGIVQRSDGESVIWVNGKPIDGATDDGMRIVVSPTSQGSVVVREPGKGRDVELRVGQRANLLTGRVDDVHERRHKASRRVDKPSAAPPTPPIVSRDKRTEERAAEDEQLDRLNRNGAPEAAPAGEDKAAQ